MFLAISTIGNFCCVDICKEFLKTHLRDLKEEVEEEGGSASNALL